MTEKKKPNPIVKSTLTWKGEHLFTAGVGDRTHLIDADSKIAPGPVEALLGAIAACSGVDVIDILAKRRTPADRMRIEVIGERQAAQPRRLIKLRLEVHLDGASIEPDQAERAITLAFEKYCSVAGSLAPDIAAESVLVLNGSEYPANRLTVWCAVSNAADAQPG